MPSEDEDFVQPSQSISAGTAFRIRYASTNEATSTGNAWRTVLAERPGVLSETQYSKASDTTPGWWMHHGADLKFFVNHRLITVAPVRGEGLPLRRLPAAAAALEVGTPPVRWIAERAPPAPGPAPARAAARPCRSAAAAPCSEPSGGAVTCS